MPKKKISEETLQELIRVIEAGEPSLLMPILQRGVTVDQKIGDGYGSTLLQFAIEKNAVSVVRMLIRAGAKLDRSRRSPLVYAALFNRLEIVELLLEAGANPNIIVSNPDENVRGETALMYAVDQPDKIRVVELLLKHKANPALANSKGETALDIAVEFQNIDAVRLLLAAGCKPVGPIMHGPVFRGTKKGLELVRMLIAAGADLNAIGNREAHLQGRTALEGAREQLKEKMWLIKQLEARRREDWDGKTLERWKDEASIFQEMIEELTVSKL